MNAFSQKQQWTLGIRGRLFAGFAAIFAILLAAFAVVLVKISMAENFSVHVLETDLPAHELSYTFDLGLVTANSAAQTWIITQDSALKKEALAAWDNIEKTQGQLDAFSSAWGPKLVNDWQRIKALLSQIKTDHDKLFNEHDNKKMQLLLKNDILPLTDKLLTLLDGPMTETGDRVGGLFDVQLQQLQTSSQDIINGLSVIKTIEAGMLLVVLAASFFIAWITAKRILTPLNSAIWIAQRIAHGERNISIAVLSKDETGTLLTALSTMQQSIQESEAQLKISEAHTREMFDEIVKKANLFSNHSSKVAAGDLRQRLSCAEEDEMDRLGTDLNTMTENLSAMTQQITQACHNMVSTIEQVKHTVDVQSSGASEQASSINQITASLGEIEKSSTQTIEKAKSLGEAADRTREKGQMGLEAVEQSIAGMKNVKEKVQAIAQTILDLSTKTQQVGEITAVVNGLAQQSKMLALNASIEAAKAGEAGKGFAVVASEVKSLAEQSEESTSQVQKILEDIRHATEKAVMATEEGTKGVDYGTTLVEQTGEVVRSLSGVISETTVATQQIEAAVRQESIGIEQITAGMNEINQVTSAFVESVKQTTTAIHDLSSIAHNLKEHVDVYKT